MSKVTVGITACMSTPERQPYLEDTCRSLRDKLQPDQHVVGQWLISAEWQKCCDRQWLRDFCQREGWELIWQPGRPGLGRNLNMLHANFARPYLLYMQDDQPLLRTLGLAEAVDVLESDAADMVQFQWPFDKEGDAQPADRPGFCVLNPNKTWYYTDQPHLTSRRLSDRLGPYDETEYIITGMSEVRYAMTVREQKVRIWGTGNLTDPRSRSPFNFAKVTTSAMPEKWEANARFNREAPGCFDDPLEGFTGNGSKPGRQFYARAHWLAQPELSALRGQPIRYLELGVGDGMLACWVYKYVLTHEQSCYQGVDMWIDQTDAICAGRNVNKLVRAKLFAGDIVELRDERPFDVIYHNGECDVPRCLHDLLGAWPRLKPGGLLLVNGSATAKQAVQLLLASLTPEKCRLIVDGYQFLMQKV